MKAIYLICATLAAAGLAHAETAADPLFADAPPAPPGYETHTDAQRAVLTGEVPMMNPSVEVPDGITFHDDLVYSEPEDGVALEVDVYLPEESSDAPPLLVFIHGGGWTGGKKEDYVFYNIEFAKLGYATASIQYRLAPTHRFPKAIQDVKAAILYLKSRADEFGYDPDTVVLLGGSAGGHLSLLAGYSQDPALEPPEAEDDADSSVAAIVNLYGVTDCTTDAAKAAHQVHSFLGGKFDEVAELYTLSSPMHHLDASDPPTLTFHGTIDELVPIAQADMLHDKLDELGIANHYDRIEGWPHTMDLAKPINERVRYITERFLEKYAPLK